MTMDIPTVKATVTRMPLPIDHIALEDHEAEKEAVVEHEEKDIDQTTTTTRCVIVEEAVDQPMEAQRAFIHKMLLAIMAV